MYRETSSQIAGETGSEPGRHVFRVSDAVAGHAAECLPRGQALAAADAQPNSAHRAVAVRHRIHR